MSKKLTKEEFLETKRKLQEIIDRIDYTLDFNKDNPDFDADKYSKEEEQEYIKLIKSLLSYDLSDIPFSYWEGMIISSDEVIDFSNTHANLDFSLIDIEEPGIFKGCKILHPEEISRYNPETFDKEFIKAHPDMFLTSDYPQDFQKKFYDKEIEIADVSKLELKQIVKLVEKHRDRLDYSVISMWLLNIKDSKFIAKMIKLYSLNIDDYKDMEKVIQFLNGEHLTEDFINNIKNVKVENLKEYTYKYLKDTLINKRTNNVINIEYFPESFRQYFKEFFDVLKNLPNELKNNFTRRALSFNYVYRYLDFFKDIVIDNFILESDKLYQFSQQIGFGNIQKIMLEYRDVFPAFVYHNYKFPSWLEDSSVLGENYFETVRKRFGVYKKYLRFNSPYLKDAFSQFMEANGRNVTSEKVDTIIELFSKIEYSNSLEIKKIDAMLVKELINVDDPIAIFEEIENIFLRNNLPMVGKIYYIFQALHPHAQNFDYESARMSPVLKSASPEDRESILFNDLMRAGLGSNNRSLRDYIRIIENGYELFQKLSEGTIEITSLSEEDLDTLKNFASYLNTLYNQTRKGKENVYPRENKADLKADLEELSQLFQPTSRYDLKDRLARMFASGIGIKSFEELKERFETSVIEADKRGREYASQKFALKKGDLIKGIGGITFLNSILQNGVLSKEFLGADADGDCTPLDTDFSVCEDEYPNLFALINYGSISSDYGPIWIILKDKPGRFMVTRGNATEAREIEAPTDYKRFELFHTGNSKDDAHYGIRTGLPSTEIDYIVTRDVDHRIELEIAKNGFYIPILNSSGDLIFTPEDYDKLRSKMAGLKYYDLPTFHYSEEFLQEYESMSDVEKENLSKMVSLNAGEVAVKRKMICNHLANVLSKYGTLNVGYAKDLTEGIIELIDTGSTGRGTNIRGDGDFDFMLKFDNKVISNQELMNEIVKTLIGALPHRNTSGKSDIIDGNLRFENVEIPGLKEKVKIDITFATRTNKIDFSTDLAIASKLEAIKEEDPRKYDLVIQNIINAKMLLKKAGVYKKGKNGEGGLGGVGIENWILQNGGSLESAINDFLSVANNCRDFEEFKNKYQIWDFGQNHESGRNYPHDNFVYNMTAEGYAKMLAALKEYLEKKKEMKNTLEVPREISESTIKL